MEAELAKTTTANGMSPPSSDKKTLEQKVASIWDLVSNGQKSIARGDLAKLIKETCARGSLSMNASMCKKLASSFFNEAGGAAFESLDQAQFSSGLRQRRDLVLSFHEKRDESAEKQMQHQRILSLSKSPRRPMQTYLSRLRKTLRVWLIDDFVYTFWMATFFLGQVAGFAVGFHRNDHGPAFKVQGWSLPLAKGSAQAIQVILIMFPFTMARSFLTFLRILPLAKLVPVNKQLNVHKELGYHLLLWSTVHTVCHLINNVRTADPSRHHNALPLVRSQADIYSDQVQITGVLLFFFLIFGYFFAATWPGRQQLLRHLRIEELFSIYEVFYVTHIVMGLALLILLLIHPWPGSLSSYQPNQRGTTWIYLLAGTFVCLLERLARLLKRFTCKTAVLGVVLHEGGVTELQVQKPKLLRKGYREATGRAGQFCFLNVPELSYYEWHPFSITSGPDDDFLSFHIQGVGRWTNNLYQLCKERFGQAEDADFSHTSKHNDLESGTDTDGEASHKEQLLLLHVDGPFGSPAQDHSAFTCLLLVGAGNGVTPFLSVLKQLISEHKHSLHSGKQGKAKQFKPRKVYFYWLTRNQTAPRYFRKTLGEIKKGDGSYFLEINICLTCAVASSDPLLTVTNVANLINHGANGFDAFTGAYQPTPCLFGRPDWPVSLAKISKENPGSKVGVFVCGPPGLAKELKALCRDHSKSEGRASFVFHKELF